MSPVTDVYPEPISRRDEGVKRKDPVLQMSKNKTSAMFKAGNLVLSRLFVVFPIQTGKQLNLR